VFCMCECRLMTLLGEGVVLGLVLCLVVFVDCLGVCLYGCLLLMCVIFGLS
jgi:hypothetical protein